MIFTVQLPANYVLEIDERIALEERFQRAFKTIINKYSEHEVLFDKNSFFNVDQEENGTYLRLKTLSPYYPKEMQEEIVSVFTRIFISKKQISSH